MSSSLCLGPSVVVLGLLFLMVLLDGRLLSRLWSMLVIISHDQSLVFLTLQLMLAFRRVLLVGFPSSCQVARVQHPAPFGFRVLSSVTSLLCTLFAVGCRMQVWTGPIECRLLVLCTGSQRFPTNTLSPSARAFSCIQVDPCASCQIYARREKATWVKTSAVYCPLNSIRKN